ncbi:type 1 glutamine amidotransferase domain-containing protein [Cutibacterium sp.]|uniref:type 1 glutamine amidotransferase domain-containing protein n=1 Tax=Cutibacterium sp. TaxID=1912221 RepID=UPI0026DC80F5|nr:type 1 glutamine amidotransferase domain-containing protein [Cutibacterium sp.]MDO4412378.1 type 1 glutamine amidotransferase domain-containing protein [Cutibacterium sp.]
MTARALIAVTDFGVEEAEIVEPLNALKKAGIEVTVASNSGENIQTVTGDKNWASTVDADSKLSDAKAADYDLLVIPGGTVNADALRVDEDGRRLVKEFSSAGKPVGAICHGPWVLIDAGVAKSKKLTSYISIRPDLENAGANWVDEELVRCPGNDWVLITSRNPNDLPAFTKALVDEVA